MVRSSHPHSKNWKEIFIIIINVKNLTFPILVLKCKHIAEGNWKAISFCLTISWIMSPIWVQKGSLYSILGQDNLHVLSEFCFFETRTRSKPNKQHLFIKFYKIIFIKAMTVISNSQNSPKFTTFGMASIKFMIPSCASVTNKVYIPVLLLSSKKPMYYKNRLEHDTCFLKLFLQWAHYKIKQSSK